MKSRILTRADCCLEVEDLSKYAVEIGLDIAKFDDCVDISKYSERVRDGIAQGARLGVSATPTLYINGRLVTGAQPYDALAALIDEELTLQNRR